MIIMNKIKCFFNIHDNECVSEEIIYGIVDLDKIQAMYKKWECCFRCKRCGKEEKI